MKGNSVVSSWFKQLNADVALSCPSTQSLKAEDKTIIMLPTSGRFLIRAIASLIELIAARRPVAKAGRFFFVRNLPNYIF